MFGDTAGTDAQLRNGDTQHRLRLRGAGTLHVTKAFDAVRELRPPADLRLRQTGDAWNTWRARTADERRASSAARRSTFRRAPPPAAPRPAATFAPSATSPPPRTTTSTASRRSGNSFCTLTLDFDAHELKESQLLGPGSVEDTINQLLEDDSDIEAAI